MNFWFFPSVYRTIDMYGTMKYLFYNFFVLLCTLIEPCLIFNVVGHYQTYDDLCVCLSLGQIVGEDDRELSWTYI
jgi:hypothetical protein